MKEAIPVIFSSDSGYEKPLGVAIFSLIANTSSPLSIYILDSGISENAKSKMLLMQKENIKIEFINVNLHIDENLKNQFTPDGRISIATYYRLFIADIFPQYEKVIYLDCDMLILQDIAELYNIEISDNYVGASRTAFRILETIKYNIKKPHGHIKYCYEVLKLKNPKDYFNSGTLLMNLKQMRKDDFTKKCIQALKEITDLRLPDEAILNVVCEEKVHFLPPNWNFFFLKSECEELPEPYQKQFIEAFKNPYIIHFAGSIKPWNIMNKKINEHMQNHSHTWWHYARQTDFYEELIFERITEHEILIYAILNYRKNKITYYRYKLLSQICFGRLKLKYKEKETKLKRNLKEIKNTMQKFSKKLS